MDVDRIVVAEVFVCHLNTTVARRRKVPTLRMLWIDGLAVSPTIIGDAVAVCHVRGFPHEQMLVEALLAKLVRADRRCVEFLVADAELEMALVVCSDGDLDINNLASGPALLGCGRIQHVHFLLQRFFLLALTRVTTETMGTVIVGGWPDALPP